MPSHALRIWQNRRARELDEIAIAHASIGGTGRGRRYATQQVNHAYLTLLSAQFQGFCRDLHSECVDHLLVNVTPIKLQKALREACVTKLSLDKGNPNQASLMSDFSRLGFDITTLFGAQRGLRLTLLNHWRNAIAHQDFDPAKLGNNAKLRLANVRDFRRLCNRLARMLDKISSRHILAITGQQPWP